MSTVVVVAEKSATVRKMIEIAIDGLDTSIHCADHGAAALQAVRDNVPALVMIRNDLPGEDAYTVTEQMRADPALKHIPVILLLGRNQTPDVARSAGLNFAGHLSLPFKTQALVEIVCTALKRETPDVDLYRPYMMEIPLAQPTPKPETHETTQAEVNVAAESEGSDPEMLIETSAKIEQLTVDTSSQDGEDLTYDLPEDTNDTFGEAATRQDISRTDAFASTEVFTIPRSGTETMDLSVNEVMAVAGDFVSDSSPVIADDSVSDENQTIDDLEATKEDDVITNVVPPAAPVAPLPDVDELVDRVTEAISQGAALRGAVSEVSREIIEQVAWEVVPALAEALLKEEISKIIRQDHTPQG